MYLEFEVGELIKYYRKKSNMTQSELCKDICSVSHLSKIENGVYQPNKEILDLLIVKLDIGKIIDEYKNIEKKFEGELDYFFEMWIWSNFEAMDEVIKKIESLSDEISDSPSKIRYWIAKLLQTIRLEEKNESKHYLELIESHEKIKFEDKSLYILIKGMFLNTFKSTTSAIEFYKENIKFILDHDMNEYNFRLGMFLTKNNNFTEANIHLNFSFIKYSSSLNFIKMYASLSMMALNYERLGLIDKANEEYLNLINASFHLKNQSFYFDILYNFGLFLKRCHKFDEAVFYFMKCEKHFSQTPLKKVLVILAKWDSIFRMRAISKDESKQFDDDMKFVLSIKGLSKKYKLYVNYLCIRNKNDNDRHILFLENVYLPFLIKNQMLFEIKELYSMLAKHYEKNNDLKYHMYILNLYNLDEFQLKVQGRNHYEKSH